MKTVNVRPTENSKKSTITTEKSVNEITTKGYTNNAFDNTTNKKFSATDATSEKDVEVVSTIAGNQKSEFRA